MQTRYITLVIEESGKPHPRRAKPSMARRALDFAASIVAIVCIIGTFAALYVVLMGL